MRWPFNPPKKPDITVFTAVVGTRAALRDDQNSDGAAFLAYSDKAVDSATWEITPACDLFRSARRNARIHKILSHEYVDSHYSVWMDGNVALRVPAPVIVDEWLRKCDVAAFVHSCRSCIFDEAAECAARGLDAPALIGAQASKYRSSGFGPGKGLAETTVVVRRHTPQVIQFNNFWWAQVCRFSVRDQLSFMYAAQQTGIRVRLIAPPKLMHPYFDILRTRAEPESPAAASPACTGATPPSDAAHREL